MMLPAPGDMTGAIADALADLWAAAQISVDSDGNVTLNLPNSALSSLASDPIVLASLTTAFNQGAKNIVTWNAPPTAAIDYARQRAAELVGMRRTASGALIQNPNPKWSIRDSTRDMLQGMVVRALEQGEPMRDLKEHIQQLPEFASIFGEYRAEMIARTENQMAMNQGNLSAITRDGYDNVYVLDNEECPLCSPFAGTIQTVQWARENPVQHPHCVRSFSPVTSLKKDGGTAGAGGAGIGVGTGLTGYRLEGQKRCPLNCRNGKRPNGNDCPHKSHTR